MYGREYIKSLEDLIMDELLPMYIIGCRSSGRDPKVNEVLKKLMENKKLKKEMPWLLQQK
jgi:hypothetical protein